MQETPTAKTDPNRKPDVYETAFVKINSNFKNLIYKKP